MEGNHGLNRADKGRSEAKHGDNEALMAYDTNLRYKRRAETNRLKPLIEGSPWTEKCLVLKSSISTDRLALPDPLWWTVGAGLEHGDTGRVFSTSENKKSAFVSPVVITS